jgi:TolB-like protein
MAHKTNSFERFWKELKRRKVVHVIAVYAAVAFVILQLVDMVAEPLRLPASTKALVIVLLCIGFVIAIFLSWIYDITPSGVKKTKPVGAIKPTDQTTHEVSSGWKVATYISAFIILALVAFNLISRRNLNADISKLEKSIAVLPFINDSPSDSTTYFINGLMEEILNNLQKIGAFSKVHSRTSTEQYRGITKPPIPKIAKDLDVNFIVEGSGQKYGNFYRIRVQLIEGKTDKHLWVNSYEREIKGTKDIYGIQSQIAQSIAAELKTVITPEEKQRIEKVPTNNLTAHAFYQRGREEEGKFPYYALASSSTLFQWYDPSIKDKQALEIAEKMYKTSLKYDSTFSLAYSGLAGIYWGKNYYKEYFSEDFLDSVLILANHAISLDDQLPDAHYIKGMYYWHIGINEKAHEELDKTLKLNPNYWLAYFGEGNLYFDEDDYVMAIDNFKKAISHYRGSGLSDVYRWICLTLYFSGFNELGTTYNLEATKLETDSIKYYFWLNMFENNTQKRLEFLKKGYKIDSTNNLILEYLGDYYRNNGQYKESLKFWRKYLNRLKEQGIIRVNNMHRIGQLYLKIGLKDSAAYYFNKQKEYCNDAIRLGRPYGNNWAYYDLAGVYAFMGNKIKAYENLKILNQRQRMPRWLVEYLKTDELFDGIRNEPEFQQIVRDVEAKYQAEHERVRKWLEEQGMLEEGQ